RDPWKRVLLTDGDENVVARKMNNRLARRHELPTTILVLLRRDFLEREAGQLTVVVRERLGNKIVVDRDALVHRILFFPRRCFHLVEARTDDDVDLLAAQTPRAAAAIHRGISPAHHDDALADRRDVAERHRRQPIDADMNVLARLVASGNRDIAPAWRTAADEHGVELLFEQRTHRVDAGAAAKFDALIQDVAHFLVDHAVRQAEFRDLRAHHAAALTVAVEDHALVAERYEIACNSQRSGPGANQRDAFAITRCWGLGEPSTNVALVIGGNAFESADRNGLRLGAGFAVFGRTFFDASAPARRLARTIARAAQNPRENVRFPVDHVRV